MIKSYTTLADYQAAQDAKSVRDNSVSRIDSTGEIIIDGSNIITDSPVPGDIVVRNENGNRLFIKGTSYEASEFPSVWETKGVVIWRQGNMVAVSPKTTTSAKFLAVYPWVITGYTLDGESHTASINIRKTGAISFTYAATTVEDFVSQLQQWISDNAIEDTIAYINAEDQVVLQWNALNASDDTTASGLTFTAKVTLDGENRYISRHRRRNHENYAQCLWNMNTAPTYYAQDLNNTSNNPDTPLTSAAYSSIICLPAYLGTSQYRDGDMCAVVREVYGEGEAGWLNYLEGVRVESRTPLEHGRAQYRDGKEFTYLFAGKTCQDADGNEQYLYPAIQLAAETDLDLDDMRAGDFFIPSLVQFEEFFKNVKPTGYYSVDEYDPINAALYKIGGTMISRYTSFLLGGLNNRLIGWYADCDNGHVNTNWIWDTRQVQPVSLFSLASD